MPVKKSPLLITLGAAVLLIGVGAGAYWILTRRGVLPGDLPTGANVVPDEALMAISISTDEGQWRALRSFGTPATQASFDQNLANLRDRILTANGLNYEQDIEPWVGDEVTIAFMPTADAAEGTAPNAAPEAADPNPDLGSEDDESADAETEDSATDEPSAPENFGDGNLAELDDSQPLVIVLPIADPLKAQEILGNSELTKDSTSREYKGVEVQEFTAEDSTAYSAAVFDTNYVVLTTDQQAIEATIDTFKGEESIAQIAGYRNAFNQIQTDDLVARLYVNVPAATAIAAQNSNQPVSPESLSTFQNNQGLAISVGLKSNGVRFAGIAWLPQDSEFTYEVTNTVGQIPELLPSDTLAMVSGSNLKQLWQDYARSAASRPLTPLHPESIRTTFESTTGLNLEADLLDWADGEFSLSLLPIAAPESDDPSTQPLATVAPVIIVQPSDRALAEQTFEKLDEVLSSRYRFQVEPTEMDGQSVVNWVSPFGALTLTRGWLEGNQVFLAIGPTAAQRILAQPSPSLAESQPYKTVMLDSPDSNNGHFYVDLNRFFNTDGIPLPPFPSQSQEVANSINAIGVTASILNPRTIRYDVNVSLKKGERPGALPNPEPTEPTPEELPAETPEEQPPE